MQVQVMVEITDLLELFTDADSALANSGSGGGGGGENPDPFSYGGNGGSGIVIVAYPFLINIKRIDIILNSKNNQRI